MRGYFIARGYFAVDKVTPDQGFEPRFAASETVVLPLDESGM